MKLIFRRELGNEQYFVLWQKTSGVVVAVPEWLSSLILMIFFFFLAIEIAREPIALWIGLLLGLMIIVVGFEIRLRARPWNRLD